MIFDLGSGALCRWPTSLPARARFPALIALAATLLAGCDDPARPPGRARVACDASSSAIKVKGQSIPVAPNGYATAGNQIISNAAC
ncbi:MAG: hypothetical protein M3P24_03795, partial [Gemmatimonadota bacterium]|nr:hypothetical protein [Gemmatimonadota bacterium]